MTKTESEPHVRHPELYRDDAVHGVDYTTLIIPSWVAGKDGGVTSVLRIERQPLPPPSSSLLQDQRSG